MRLDDELSAKLALARIAATKQAWHRIQHEVRWNDLAATHDVMVLDPNFPPPLRWDLAALANLRAYADLVVTPTDSPKEILLLSSAVQTIESMLDGSEGRYTKSWRMMLNVRLAQLLVRTGEEGWQSAVNALDKASALDPTPLDNSALLVVTGTVYHKHDPPMAIEAFNAALQHLSDFQKNEEYGARVKPLCTFTRLWLAHMHYLHGSKRRAWWHAIRGRNVHRQGMALKPDGRTFSTVRPAPYIWAFTHP